MTDATVSPPKGDDAPTRAGFVALLGAPNVGKSTLLNRLVGTKVSIVSPKVQTTRRRVIGITIHDRAQIVFVDTPGIFTPKRRLERAMVKAAWQGAEDADLDIFVLDARRGLDDASQLVLDGLEQRSRRAIAVVNKLDLVRPQQLLPLIAKLDASRRIDEVFLVSAQTGDGCGDVLRAIAARMPKGPWLYPEDQLSDLSNRAMAAEITREQIFLKLHQELPYSITVETESFVESPDGEQIRIDQVVYVQRDTQKAIVLGKGGRQIKAIGQGARAELERLFEARVHLFLFVKVREAWTDDPERYAELGLDFPG